ncbi:unnamed protein product, partial [Menidia menidia]
MAVAASRGLGPASRGLGPASLSRFRGALVAAVLGDCVGGEFEGAEEVPMESVLKKLASPQLQDVFQPARDQFSGRGSFGNGGAMRAAPFALAFPKLADVKRFSHLGALLTHSCSLGYNGAVLQALAVHLALQGALDLPQQFIGRLIAEMEE